MAVPERKAEREELSKQERLKQIERMRQRLNQHTANQNRDIATKNISNNTQKLIQEKLAELPAQNQEPDRGKSMER